MSIEKSLTLRKSPDKSFYLLETISLPLKRIKLNDQPENSMQDMIESGSESNSQTRWSDIVSQSNIIKKSPTKNSLYTFEEQIPLWATKENLMDNCLRKPSDSKYDPSKLYIPKGEFDNMVPMMRQYWTIKAEYFDKILFFKYGRFYETYFEDAIICHKELDLAWVGQKLNVGFPEKSLESYSRVLVDKGYKVCIVEQTESPKQMNSRLKESTSKSMRPERVLKREPIRILTKGTIQDIFEKIPRYAYAIKGKQSPYSVAIFEADTLKIFMGLITDGRSYNNMKMLICQLPPSELIYNIEEIDPELILLMKNTPKNPAITIISDKSRWDSNFCLSEMKIFYENQPLPQELKNLEDFDDDSKEYMCESLSGLFCFLKDILLLEDVLINSKFEILDQSEYFRDRMIIDSTALSALEIIETSEGERDSLLAFLDKTVTKFGSSTLRNWVIAPSLRADQINERLDAIEELENNNCVREMLRTEMRPLQDLDRLCKKVYMFAIQQKTVFFFEDIAIGKIKELSKLLDLVERGITIIDNLQDLPFHSKLLSQICNWNRNSSVKSISEMYQTVKDLQNSFVWEGENRDIPTPASGYHKEYDEVKEGIESIHKQFGSYLLEIQRQFRDPNISYAHTRHRYELEIPSHLIEGSKKPSGFEFSSKKKGVERFVTNTIKALVEELEGLEEQVCDCLNLFIKDTLVKFRDQKAIWDCIINTLGLLDCLCSLSLVSFQSDMEMCRPQIVSNSPEQILEVTDFYHPILLKKKGFFVTNNLNMNQKLILLTGPNMGGKSTVLRQLAIIVVMGQIGCYTPASSCRFTLVDRIFTRIGATDTLLFGKSTFYIEMEEMSNIVRYATKNSLVLIDELGRGTSTFDGIAIAYAIMRYILNFVKSRCLFSTHYHTLLDEFRENKEVNPYQLTYDVDTLQSKITFLYKLEPGECERSLGLNIASIAGISNGVIQLAKSKTIEFAEKQIMDKIKENIEFLSS